MANFFAELKRRQMFRVAVAYAVVAWLLLQVVNNVAPVLDLPVWVARAFLLALVIGFPIALLFVWMRDLAPADAAATKAATTKLDYVLAGGLILVIGLVSYQQLASPGSGAIQQSSVVPITAAQPSGITVAVLPFGNLSGDVTQEFFSDGMTEEITAALAKVQSLRVVARASAFQFKGERRDMRTVGQALGARYLIDGSVRKEGIRVRITAQLIEAENGVSVWTESYDRELTSVFATQEDIAQAIAGALKVPLGLQQGETLVSNRTKDAAAYEDYLRAKALVRSRAVGGYAQLTEAARLLERVLAREPDFAPAWALIALDYVLTSAYNTEYISGDTAKMHEFAETLIPKAEAAARRAIELDPKHPDGYVALASVRAGRAQILEADKLFRQGLALDPGNADGLHLYSGMLSDLGYIKMAIPMRERLQAIEPIVSVFQMNDSRILYAAGDYDAALAALKLPNFPQQYAIVYAAQGRYGEAADVLQKSPDTFLPGMQAAVVGLLRMAPTPAASPQDLPRLGYLEFAYLYAGAESRVLDFYEDMLSAGWRHPTLGIMLWGPPYAGVRKTDRFKAFVRKAGFLDYWRANGWADRCRPLGTDDFVCD